MRKFTLIIFSVILFSAAFSGCKEIGENPNGKAQNPPLAVDESTTWQKLENLDKPDIITSFEYTDGIFLNRTNGSWAHTQNKSDDNSSSTYTFFWTESTSQKAMPIARISTPQSIVSGPNIDVKNKKIYLQFFNATSNTQSTIIYDFPAKKMDTRTVSADEAATNPQPADKLIHAIDPNGGIYTRNSYLSESMCNNAYDIDYYPPNTYGFTAQPDYTEKSLTGCNGPVEASITSKGKVLVSIKPNDETKVLTLSVNATPEPYELQIPYYITDDSDGWNNFSTMPNGGLFLSPDMKKGVFFYFDSIVSFPLDQKDAIRIRDAKFFQTGAEYNGEYGWDGDTFYMYNPEKNVTQKVPLLSEAMETLDGKQLPDKLDNPLQYLRGQGSCNTDAIGERYTEKSCFENAPYTEFGWNPQNY